MDGNLVTAAFGANPTLTSVALGVIILTFCGFMFGLIVPKWTVKNLLTERDARVAQANLRAEDYKRLYETTNAALTASRAQVTELLLPLGETTRRIVSAIPVVPVEGES